MTHIPGHTQHKNHWISRWFYCVVLFEIHLFGRSCLGIEINPTWLERSKWKLLSSLINLILIQGGGQVHNERTIYNTKWNTNKRSIYNCFWLVFYEIFGSYFMRYLMRYIFPVQVYERLAGFLNTWENHRWAQSSTLRNTRIMLFTSKTAEFRWKAMLFHWKPWFSRRKTVNFALKTADIRIFKQDGDRIYRLVDLQSVRISGWHLKIMNVCIQNDECLYFLK